MKKAGAAILFLSLPIALVSPCAPRVESAQSAREGESREETRERMGKLLEYVGLEKATQAEVDGMVEAWTRAARPGLSADERTAAFRDLYVQFKKLQGVDYSGRAPGGAGVGAR